MIERTLFSSDHESFRDSFRRFLDKEVAPFHAEWEEQGRPEDFSARWREGYQQEALELVKELLGLAADV